MRVRRDAGPGRNALADGDDRAPLGKASAQLGVLGDSLAKPIETLGHLLARRVRQWLRTRIDLDAGKHPQLDQRLRKRQTARGRLTEGFILQDDSADRLLESRRGDQQLSERAPGRRWRF